MKRNLLIVFSILLSACAMTSCSESDDEEYEFADWQNRNDTYFNDIYAKAESAVEAGDSKWKIIRNWSLEEDAATSPDDHIVVEVLEEGNGAGCPIYTDSVYVHYSGKLIPSVSYPDGYVFDSSYTGDFNPNTAIPDLAAASDFVDGFTTAVLNMHIGDRWRVYIPYNLGYKSTAQENIPACSTLIFDVGLAAYYHPGAPVPEWKSKGHGGFWTE